MEGIFFIRVFENTEILLNLDKDKIKDIGKQIKNIYINKYQEIIRFYFI